MMRKVILILLLISTLATAEKYALLVGINDYQNDIGALKYCVADVQAFQQALIQTAGYKPENTEVTMRASTTNELDKKSAETMIRLLDALEDLDDVQKVYSNAEIPDDILAELN